MKRTSPSFQTDFLDMLKELNRVRCRFVIVGAHAMAAWGYTRATGDLDLFVQPTKENAKRLWKALDSFGAPLAGVRAEDFSLPGVVFQIGIAPVRIDILTQIDGVPFSEAFRRARKIQIQKVPVRILSLFHLIVNKRATGRPQDKIDVKVLKALKDK